MRRIITVTAVVLVCACDSATEPFDDHERIELSRAMRRWSEAGLVNYTIEQRQLCFCPPDVAQWARVTVTNGIAVRSVRVEDGEPLAHGSRRTVPELFEIINSVRTYDHVEDIRVQYDAKYGYPTLIEVMDKPTVADGGLTIQTRALSPSG